VPQPPSSSDSGITVGWPTPAGERRTRLTAAFCIGCDASGNLQIEDEKISTAYAAVFRREGQWWVRDLGCPNGVLLDGTPVQSSPLPPRAVLGLGTLVVQVSLDSEETGQQPRAPGGAPPVSGADDRTKLHATASRRPATSDASRTPSIRVQVGSDPTAREFTAKIRVGRDPDCTIRIDDDGVSRTHAEIFPLGNQWCVRDLGSSNGTYLDGVRIEEGPLPGRCTLRLGPEGPTLELSHSAAGAAQSSSAATPSSIEEVAAHYFDPDSKAPAGDRTMWVRRAYSTVQRRQKRRYGSVIAGAVGLLFVAVGVGIYQHFQLERTRGLAEQIFYNMKTIELQLARLDEQVEASADEQHRAEVAKGRAQLAEMSTQYDALLEELGVLDDDLPPEERLILRMARVFGECEVAMPKEFVDEVKRYIGIWRSNQRLADGLEKARAQDLPAIITRTMLEHDMPPQFFYVALQESDFRPQAIGPETRFGIAKGMWQFMPETGTQYGLRPGPLQALPEYDPEDERFDHIAASEAAARYLRDLYRGEAQASGLLVLASYNWGPTRVKKRIRAMKENPRDRNFWALLAQDDIPKETRDYVFLIFAAAVIGEDPKLFGFDFDKPLAIPQPAPTGG